MLNVQRVPKKLPFRILKKRLDDIPKLFSKTVPRRLKKDLHIRSYGKKLKIILEENSDYFVDRFYIFQARNSKSKELINYSNSFNNINNKEL